MQIAKTVRDVLELRHPLAVMIMDRTRPLNVEFCEQVMSLTQFSYKGRNPKSAFTKAGLRRKTDLDLLSLLVDLYKRSARVELTAYNNQLPWEAYAGEQHVGGTNRFGRITGLISHRSHLSFSVRMRDESVLQSKEGDCFLGADRTYMIADYTGAWHNGWHGFTWDMTAKEKAYLERRKILVDGDVDYEDYLHQNRRQSVMGAPYLLLKLLWQRIEDEILFFKREIKRLERLGIKCPKDLEPVARLKIAQGEADSIDVPIFTMCLSGLNFRGEYTPVSLDTLGYRLAHRSLYYLSQKLRPTVQFMVRADEVAFYRFGLAQDFVAHWIKGSAWTNKSPYSAELALGEKLRLSYQIGLVEKMIAV